MRSRLIVVALLASALVWAALVRSNDVRAAVGLISFDVEQVEEGIRVTWETGSEVNNLMTGLTQSAIGRTRNHTDRYGF